MPEGADNNRYSETEDRFITETPFLEVNYLNVGEVTAEATSETGESMLVSSFLETPFLAHEAGETDPGETFAPEALALAEITSELRDSEFREALENLADEALEAHSDRLEAEYGDRETQEANAERLLNEHLYPLANQMEQLVDRFFERMQAQEVQALSENEIDRIALEVFPSGQALSPLHEQFLSGWLKKAVKLGKAALRFATRPLVEVGKLAGKGLMAIGKLALGPLWEGLKRLGRGLLRHVVRFALNKLPTSVQPLAKKLSDRLFRAIGETASGEVSETEQAEREGIPAAPSVARLEAEFDVAAAQLLLGETEQENEHVIGSYTEAEAQEQEQPLARMDAAREQLVGGLERLQPGQNPSPVMEQFLPVALLALRPIARGAITLIGRPKIVKFIGDLIAKLIRPILGAEFAPLLGSAIADAGMTLLGLETSETEPRRVTTEALAAAIEETLVSVAEMPTHELENEALLEIGVREAFESAAAAYFPTGVIRTELRETTGDPQGMWVRMPAKTKRKRYAKYTRSFPVTITPALARQIRTFGNTTLQDFFRDRLALPKNQTVKGKITLYKAVFGTRGSTIARAERFSSVELHPLTPQAAGLLLGPNGTLGFQPASDVYLASPQVLQIRQRLYRIELPGTARLKGGGIVGGRPEIFLLINLRTAEIKFWMYLPEALCQQISTEMSKGRNHLAAFMLIKPLLQQGVATIIAGIKARKMPGNVRLISETPELENEVPAWLVIVAEEIGKKLLQWVTQLVIEYLQNRSDQFRQVCASRRDGVTIRVSLSRVPGMENVRLLLAGRTALGLLAPGWIRGVPGMDITTLPGRSMG